MADVLQERTAEEYEDDEGRDEDEDVEEVVEEEEEETGADPEQGEDEGTEEAGATPEDEEQDARGPNPLLTALNALRPGQLVATLRKQGKRARQLLWRGKRLAISSSKVALKVAVKAARPALVYLILMRVGRTLDESRSVLVRMGKLPENQQMDYYYSRLLGDDWQQQLQLDMEEALQEVQDGYVTDDMVAEKRKLAAVILRRLEVEEWDKQRMRHFYYGLYGLGPWYWDMEERLHNPFFTGARAWNGPIESWVGKNKTYPKDLPLIDQRDELLGELQAKTGRKLSSEQVAALKQRSQLQPLEDIRTSPSFQGLVSPLLEASKAGQGSSKGKGSAKGTAKARKAA